MTHRPTTAAAVLLSALALAVGGCAEVGSIGSSSASAMPRVESQAGGPSAPESSGWTRDTVAADEAELMGNYALMELTTDGQPVKIPQDFSVTVVNVIQGTSFIDVLGLCTRVDITAADWPDWPTEGVLYTQEAEHLPTVGCADELGGPVTALRKVLIGTVSLEMSADGSTVTLTQDEDQAVLERR